jgi:hypothetical protein
MNSNDLNHYFSSISEKNLKKLTKQEIKLIKNICINIVSEVYSYPLTHQSLIKQSTELKNLITYELEKKTKTSILN